MKKAFLTLLLLCSLQNYAFSHDSPADKKAEIPRLDSLTGTPGKLRARWFDYTLFGLTYSAWQKIPAGSDVKEDFGNIGFDIFGMRNFPLVKDVVHFGVGLGVSIMNFHTNYYMFEFQNGQPNPLLKISNPNFLYNTVTGGQEVIRNKMSLAYLEIPIEFKFQSLRDDGSRRGFLFALGARGGWLMDSHYKMVTDDAKYKTKDFDNQNRWRFGFTGRIGYGMVSLYARFDLTSTFTNVTADYKPMTFGIVIAGK